MSALPLLRSAGGYLGRAVQARALLLIGAGAALLLPPWWVLVLALGAIGAHAARSWFDDVTAGLDYDPYDDGRTP